MIQPSTTSRRGNIDLLIVMLTWIVMFFHAVTTTIYINQYGKLGYPKNPKLANLIFLDKWQDFIDKWQMPFFIFLAGINSHASLSR